MDIITAERYEQGIVACRFRAFSMDELIDKFQLNEKTKSLPKTKVIRRQARSTEESQPLPTEKLPVVPQVIITRPIKPSEVEPTSKPSKAMPSQITNRQGDKQTNQAYCNIAGRRALPEITITCPPIGGSNEFDPSIFEDGYFTERRYMICRDSPRSGKRKTCVVDFPNGLSTFDTFDGWADSPINFVDSPVSFSGIDLAFAYTGPLNSPLTPPQSPYQGRRSSLLYPGPVPVFKLEESFPPAEFKEGKWVGALK